MKLDPNVIMWSLVGVAFIATLPGAFKAADRKFLWRNFLRTLPASLLILPCKALIFGIGNTCEWISNFWDSRLKGEKEDSHYADYE